jgi:hypothetical protein
MHLNIHRLAASALVAALPIASVAACSSEPPGDGSATLTVPLTSTASNGTTYRLRNGTFAVAGPQTTTLSTETTPGAPSLQATLTTGNYKITLQQGWSMEQSTATGVTTVTAVLTSPNPATFAIADNATSNVAYTFNVNGQPVQLGNGTLNVTTNVNECDAGESACASGCVDLKTSNTNCGACGVSCGNGTCQNGACTVTCTGGNGSPGVICNGACVNLATDPNNCGACGNVCPTPTGQVGACLNGVCCNATVCP